MTLKTERLILRPATPEDVTERWVGWLNDPEVNRYLECRFIEHTVESEKAHINEHPMWTIVLRAGGPEEEWIIGTIRLTVDKNHNAGEVSYMIGDKTQWNKGYATEAVGAVTDYALDVLKLRFVWAGCYYSNKASMTILRKCGFDWVESHRGWFLLNDKPEDYEIFRRDAE